MILRLFCLTGRFSRYILKCFALGHIKLSLRNSAGRHITRSDGVFQEQHNKIRLAGVIASEIHLFKTFDKISKRGPFARRPLPGGGPHLVLPPLSNIRGAAPVYVKQIMVKCTTSSILLHRDVIRNIQHLPIRRWKRQSSSKCSTPHDI